MKLPRGQSVKDSYFEENSDALASFVQVSVSKIEFNPAQKKTDRFSIPPISIIGINSAKQWLAAIPLLIPVFTATPAEFAHFFQPMGRNMDH